MRPGRNWATKSQNYLWQKGSSNLDCSGYMGQIWTPLRINHLQVSYEVVLEAHDIPRPKSGDLPMDRFWAMHNMVSGGGMVHGTWHQDMKFRVTPMHVGRAQAGV